MDSLVTMEDRIGAFAGIGAPSWSGWEEECLADWSPLLLGEDELGGNLSAGSAKVKVEFDGNRGDGVIDNFNFDIDDTLSGVLTDDSPSWMDAGDLADILENVEEMLQYPIPEPTVKDTDTLYLDALSLNLLPKNKCDLMLGSPDEDVSLAFSGKELNATSPLEFGLLEEVISSNGDSPEPGSAESSIEDSSLDDEDWELTRRRKNGKKRKLATSIGEPSRKSMKMDPELRKKEQNKNAAIRYREKKKGEEHEQQAMCEVLERRNKVLRREIEDKEQEVRVLRQLLVDILRPS